MPSCCCCCCWGGGAGKTGCYSLNISCDKSWTSEVITLSFGENSLSLWWWRTPLHTWTARLIPEAPAWNELNGGMNGCVSSSQTLHCDESEVRETILKREFPACASSSWSFIMQLRHYLNFFFCRCVACQTLTIWIIYGYVLPTQKKKTHFQKQLCIISERKFSVIESQNHKGRINCDRKIQLFSSEMAEVHEVWHFLVYSRSEAEIITCFSGHSPSINSNYSHNNNNNDHVYWNLHQTCWLECLEPKHEASVSLSHFTPKCHQTATTGHVTTTLCPVAPDVSRLKLRQWARR